VDCPIYLADSGHQPDGYSHEQCAGMLDVFVESEGEAEVVMFSGGEPTVRSGGAGRRSMPIVGSHSIQPWR
jgi:uncharacterized radical SAM superfamily Fe-S cluster-containing enzyme